MANQTAIVDALKAQGKEVVSGKGGFWVKGEGFITLAAARKLTGLKAPERSQRPRMTLYGDLAWIAKINHIR